MVLQSWSPLGMGGKGSKQIMQGNLTTSIAKKHGKSPVQVALKWVVSQGASVSTKSLNRRTCGRIWTSLTSSSTATTCAIWTRRASRRLASRRSCAATARGTPPWRRWWSELGEGGP